METITGRIIQHQQIEIDDKKFVDCTLSDCVLGYSGRPVIFQTTRLERCHYVFFGDARNMVQFLQSVGLLIGAPGEWLPYDGTTH